MRRTVALLVAWLVVVGANPARGAGGWKRHREARLGFSMLVPRGGEVTRRTWAGGWRGIQINHRRATLFGVTMPGKKNTADMIRALAERLSGVERRHWTVIKTVKARRGWVWYCPASAAHGRKVVRAVYGLGRRGTFLMLLITDRGEARKSRSAHRRWARSVHLK